MSLRNIRIAVARWKQAQLFQSIQEDQDTTKLNDYLKITALAYDILKNYVQTGNESRLDDSLIMITSQIGPVDSLSRDEKMMLQEYLLRDLIEYPFTYNIELSNSFKKKNILDTNIIPNK